jgi:hypothetical protein
VTEAQPVEQPADIRAVHAHAASFQLDTQFVQRQIAGLGDPPAHEIDLAGKLAAARPVPLPARLQRTRFGPQLHQIVHEARRNPEMPRRLPVAVSLIDKRCNTLTQRQR